MGTRGRGLAVQEKRGKADEKRKETEGEIGFISKFKGSGRGENKTTDSMRKFAVKFNIF